MDRLSVDQFGEKLREQYQLPSELDSTEFLVVRSGLYDEYVMPEIREQYCFNR